ncbi:hypothetical protein GCM10023334_067030 [Nonomuraea thailandensis]
MWAGIAIGMGLGVTLDNLLLGISLSLCLGVALSYALVAKRETGSESGQRGSRAAEGQSPPFSRASET